MKKIKVNSQWDEKFLRESLWMPFGSMCNFLGQAYQGQKTDTAELEELMSRVFYLACQFTEEAYDRTEKANENKIDVPIKKK